MRIILSRRRLCEIGLLFIIIATSLISTRKFVFAHVVDAWKWPTNTVYYDAHLLSSQWAQAVSDGRYAWNNVSPSPFAFYRNDTSQNDIYMASLSSGVTGGEITYCGSSICNSAGSTVTRTVVKFNSTSIIWHHDVSCQVPSYAIDTRSTAAHELGHSATLAHSYCGSDPTTMCGVALKGSCAKRSLTQDDRNGLNAQYP